MSSLIKIRQGTRKTYVNASIRLLSKMIIKINRTKLKSKFLDQM